MGAEQLSRLRQDLTPRFLAYLTNRDEAGLRAAYELGRLAMEARNSAHFEFLTRNWHGTAQRY